MLVILLAFFISYAAEALTLNECIKQSIKHHPDVKIFMLKNYEAKQDTIASISSYLPQIYLDSEYDIAKTFVVQSAKGFDTVRKSPYQTGITLNQKIYDFGKTANRVRAAKISQKISSLSLEETKLLLKKQVKTIYTSLILWQKAINIRKKDLFSKKALYEQAKALRKEGLKTKADEMRFLVEVYKGRENLRYAYAQFNKAKIELGLYMGVKLPKNLSFDFDILNKNTKIQKSLNNNIELKILKKDITKNRFLYNSAKSEQYGSISLDASYYKKRDFFHYNTSFIGLKFRIPIFTGNNLSSQIQKSKLKFLIAKDTLNSKEIALKNNLSALIIDLKQTQSSINTKIEEIKSAKEIYNLTQARYKEGLSNYIEVLDADSVYLSSRLGLLQAYFDRKNIEYQIEYLTGDK